MVQGGFEFVQGEWRDIERITTSQPARTETPEQGKIDGKNSPHDIQKAPRHQQPLKVISKRQIRLGCGPQADPAGRRVLVCFIFDDQVCRMSAVILAGAAVHAWAMTTTHSRNFRPKKRR